MCTRRTSRASHPHGNIWRSSSRIPHAIRSHLSVHTSHHTVWTRRTSRASESTRYDG